MENTSYGKRAYNFFVDLKGKEGRTENEYEYK